MPRPVPPRAVPEAALFKALADPTRLALVARLANGRGPQTVGEVADCCGVHLSGVSRHLAILRRAGLVTATKAGREVRYALRGTHLSATLRALAQAIDQSPCCAPRRSESPRKR